MIKLYTLESGAQYQTKLSFPVTLMAVCCFLKKWILVQWFSYSPQEAKACNRLWSIAISELQYVYAAPAV